MPNKKLDAPPIVEVVCGLFFAPIPELDPLVLGKFWFDRRGDFTRRAFQPPITDQPGVTLFEGAAPVRSWMIHKTDEYVVQAQQDRFYFNWRKRAERYPRFNDHDGERGVLSRALEMWSQFEAFILEILGATPSVGRVELAKVDVFLRDVHWKNFADLGMLMPVVGDFAKLTKSDDPELTLRLGEERATGSLLVSLNSAVYTFDARSSHGVQLDTRMTRPVAGASAARDTFQQVNEELNDVFFTMINREELHRFDRRPA
jgi:uncharacterized protein (TIGR04255 family)